MRTVDSAGVRIRYRLAGQGRPLVLVHGYTASVRTQWELPGWVSFLAPRHRLLLVDVRGHGESEKPRQPGAYSLSLMASDVVAAMDAAGLGRADIMGYSMGAMIAMELLLAQGRRFDRAVLGGMGATWPKSRDEHCREWEDEDAPRMRHHPLEWAKSWAYFARHYDFRAMRALAQNTFEGGPVNPERLPEIEHPVLSVVGTRDRFCRGTVLLGERLPNCKLVKLSGRGHVTAVRDPRFKEAVRCFLDVDREP
ncbi:MAG: alpha/beta hydrolase [Dehalococcoidia bacterium]